MFLPISFICPTSLPTSFIVKVAFGLGGEISRVFENTLYFPDILGSELVADGSIHPAAIPGMTYAAGSFGAASGEDFGFVGPLNVWLTGIKVGTGSAYAHGTIQGDRLIGTFGYVTQILVQDSPLGSGDADEYEF